jgi:hypothetical protein
MTPAAALAELLAEARELLHDAESRRRLRRHPAAAKIATEDVAATAPAPPC